MQKENETLAGKAEKEFDAAIDLSKRRPWLAAFFILIAAASIGFNIYYKFYGIPKLQGELSNQEKKIGTLKTDVQLCETKLAPFKTAAIEMFAGSESEALAKLSVRVTEIDKQLKADKHFHEVAKINIDGSIMLGGGMSTNSPVSGWSNKCATMKENEIVFTCNNECTDQYVKFIKRSWWWPYTHLGYAECLKAKNNQEYKTHVNIGITLLKKFTLVPFHRLEHDKYLKYYNSKYPDAKTINITFKD